VLSDAATNDANVISLNDVTLNGFVNANNSEAVVSFEYGTSTGYGQAITAIQNPVTGSSPVSVSATISGLETGVVYHFRVKATNSAGTVYGEDKTFTVYTTDVVDIDPDEITIYPNPTSGIFRISGIDNCIVKIIDITGKPVLTKSIKADNTIIDLTGHSKGIYMIILLNNSGICYNRVLIY
jgi:hypothetical protein